MDTPLSEVTPRYNRDRIFHPKPADYTPEPTFPLEHRLAGHSRCTAWSSQHGRQCLQPPARGKTKCRWHGGSSLGGIASGRFKTGRYTKLPPRLVEQYQASLQDGELLNLRADIALIDARIEELTGKLDTGESGAIWKKLQGEMGDYEDCMFRARYAEEKGKPEILARAAQALSNVKQLITNGLADYAIWGEIRDSIRDRRSLVESERKRLVEMQQMIDSQQALAIMTALGLAVKTYVTDPKQLSAISAEFERILHPYHNVNSDGQ